MTTRPITGWQASASLTDDTGIIAFQFQPGGPFSPPSKPIPSPRLAAVIAVLESSQQATLTDAGDGHWFVSNSPNAPGLH
ncbi:MAG: hypothetical protein IAE77_19605 [Prosthecobacter sp.]|jgi:hypothetical protein|uniref:hypothetical protein n=1 Tax=Prosthecobacter sp. TaxID=1965333 RepID=UPI0019F11604|nr:hypothetical protein [Prosthecobacter sp.]MBE2285678.1 hypothetical protein [Prosthecobacter sp.]